MRSHAPIAFLPAQQPGCSEQPGCLVTREDSGSGEPGSKGPFDVRCGLDLKAPKQEVQKWIWKGMVAAGKVTLLTSQWKSGKTTLVSVLLSRLGKGGVLAGQPVSAGRAVVMSEEDIGSWRERDQMLPLGDHIDWFFQPFLGKASYEDWRALLEQIGRIHEKHPIQLLVIDSLANLSPMRSENEAGEMLKALLPLQRLTSRGVGVLVLHHPRKGKILPGQAARGSGALSGFVDIIVEMKLVDRRNPKDRRRQLRGYSRHVETPPTWVIELTADRTDYISLGYDAGPSYEASWPIIRDILEKSLGLMTRDDVLREWPQARDRPPRTTLWRWLDRLVREDQVLREGDGTKNRPHRYSLPGMELKWEERRMQALLRGYEMPLPKMKRRTRQ